MVKKCRALYQSYYHFQYIFTHFSHSSILRISNILSFTVHMLGLYLYASLHMGHSCTDAAVDEWKKRCTLQTNSHPAKRAYSALAPMRKDVTTHFQIFIDQTPLTHFPRPTAVCGLKMGVTACPIYGGSFWLHINLT